MMRSTSAERDRRLAERAAAVGVHRLDDVADEGLVLRPVGREAGRLVAAPDDDVGGALDLLDLVAVDHPLVAGEVDHPAAAWRAAPGRSRTARRCRGRRRPAARSRPRASRSACRSGPSGSPARPASAGRRGRTSRPSPARWSRAGRCSLVDRGAGEREALPSPGACRRVAGARRLEVLQPVELAGLEGARGHRRAHHHLDDVGRQADRPRARSARSSSSSVREQRLRRASRGGAARQHAR